MIQLLREFQTIGRVMREPLDYDRGPTPWPEPHSLVLFPGEPPRRVPIGDPYNTVSAPPAGDVIEWDDTTVEAVVLETPPEDTTAILPFPGEHP